MIYTYRNLIWTFLQMITWWYIHCATLYQFSCRETPDDMYIPQVYINFHHDKHWMIYTYRNFISIFLQMNSWWYIHTATLYQFPCRWTRDDIYILQLYMKFPADDDLMIYTYRNFVSFFLQMNPGWYIHILTLYQFSCRWTRDDIYIPELYMNFPADAQQMIYTYRNFISTFLQMNTWWYIHTPTLYQFSCRWTPHDMYIPQLYINFSPDKHLIIYTYCNFISIFLQLNTWWYIHTATWYELSSRWSPDDIYIAQLYINFPAEKHLMICTYRKFISTFITINTGWYIHTATLYQFSCRWTLDDIYIPQLYINFPADEHVMIYTYCNFIWSFLQMMTWWYIHTATLYHFSCRWTPDDIYTS